MIKLFAPFYHRGSRNLLRRNCGEDDILEPILSNGENLNEIIQQVLSSTSNKTPNINYAEWLASTYKPTPNIIEAAQALYEGHAVDEISRSDAGATNLTITSDK